MRTLLLVLLSGLLVLTAAGAVRAQAPGARLLGKQPTLVAGRPWDARFTVQRAGKPLAGLQPRFWIRGPVSRSFRSGVLGRGRYVARVVFPTPGRYRFGVAVEEVSLRLGAATVGEAPISIRAPLGLAVGPDGAVYVADVEGTTVLRVDPRTKARTVAARGLKKPVFVTFDRDARLLVADDSNRIFRFGADGTRVLVAGNGRRAHTGDGGPATAASLGGPSGMDIDAAGNLVVAEYDGWIRVIRPDGSIGSLAGDGTEGYSGDGGPAVRAVLRHPHDVALLPDGAIVVADSHNQAVRIISADGVMRTLERGLGAPVGVAPAPNGGVYVAEGDGRITLLGRNGGSERMVDARTPFGIASDHAGNVYFSELESNRVKRVDAETKAVTILVP